MNGGRYKLSLNLNHYDGAFALTTYICITCCALLFIITECGCTCAGYVNQIINLHEQSVGL